MREPVLTLAIPPAAVAVPAHAHADRSAVLGASGLPRRAAPRAPAAIGTAKISVAGSAFWRLLAILDDLGAVILIVYAIPVAILAVGVPIALLIRLGMWIASISF